MTSMTTQNLYHYIKTGAFLHNIKNPYDLIVWEKIPDASLLPQSDDTAHITFAELWYDMSATWTLLQKIGEYKNVVLVLDTLWSRDIQELLQALSWLQAEKSTKLEHLTILSLWAWVTGIINKHTIDTQDLHYVLPVMQVAEPIDTYHLHYMLQEGGYTYIRVGHDDIADHLFEDHDQRIYQNSYISLKPFGYSGISGTILTIGWLLPYTSQALQYVDTTYGKKFDLFVCGKYDDTLSEELVDSIKHTWRLIIVHDQSTDTVLTQFVEKFLAKYALTDIQVLYKHPQYQLLSTLLPGYIHEQAGVGSENLAEYFISLG